MAKDSLTLQVPTETKAKLERLAGHTHRTHDVLAGEALEEYLDRELAIIEAIERARAEIRAGEGLTKDRVFADVDAVISGIEALQARR